MTAPQKIPSLQRLLNRFHFSITLLAVAISGMTVFLAGMAALRGYAESNLELASQLGAYSVEPALVFNDPTAARDAIQPLTKLPGIANVEVVDANGRILANWKRPSRDLAPIITGLFFSRPVDTNIARNGAYVGRIRLWGDSSALGSYVRAGLIGGLLCLLITAIGTLLIARRFARSLTAHISSIAEVAHDVRLHRSFAKRVGPIPVEELNRLGKDINALLDELAGWHRSVEDEKAHLSRRALLDSLTGLSNRSAFDQHMAKLIADANASGQDFSLLYFDADRFKATNDQFGHAAGDALLKAIASRISSRLQSSDMAARLGGDEFVVVTGAGRGGSVGEALARALDSALSEPFSIGAGIDFIPSVSIGMSQFPRDGKTIAELLNVADLGMYRTKQAKAIAALR